MLLLLLVETSDVVLYSVQEKQNLLLYDLQQTLKGDLDKTSCLHASSRCTYVKINLKPDQLTFFILLALVILVIPILPIPRLK